MCLKAMITVLVLYFNTFSQKLYDQMCLSLNLYQVNCSCGCTGKLIRYGHYSRSLKIYPENLILSIQRLLCLECGRTHAVLPSLIVPYSQIPLRDHVDIICTFENGTAPGFIMERNPFIDSTRVKYIICQYINHWRQRYHSSSLFPLDLTSLHEYIVISWFRYFSRQFMQIHSTPNVLFVPANTS